MVYQFFGKKIESGASVNEQSVEELHDPVIKKFEKRRVYTRLKDILGQQVQLEWNHCLLKIEMLNIFIMKNNPLKDKKR